MKYSDKSLDLIRALCVAAIFIFFVNACTEVDDRLGASLLPKNQKMQVKVENLEGMKTYLHKVDGIASSRLGHAFIGKESDDVFGKRTNSFLVQFLPTSLPASYGSGTVYPNFGIDPIIDSIRIILTLDDSHGDTTVMQSFEVFEIEAGPGAEKLHRDSIYYSDFPIAGYRGKRLFEFTVSGGTSVATKLEPTQDGKDFMRRLISLDIDKEYKIDTVFHEKFQGLYIVPAESSPEAAIYAADLSQSGLELYMRIHDTLDVTAIYDTTYCTFLFRDTDDSSSGYSLEWDNVSVNMVEHDYSGSTLGILETGTNGFTDTLETDNSQPRLYIQSMGGVAGYLRFTEEMVNTLRHLQFQTDEVSGEEIEYDIQINQAMMYVWIDEGGDIVEALDNSIKRLGSYSDLRNLVPIPDYMYVYERQYQSQSTKNATYKLPYNGYLNRSNAYYEFDITSFVQQLAKEPDDPEDAIDPVIKLAPEAYSMFQLGQSVLRGDGGESDKPVNIRLTYTLIEKPGR